MKRSTFFRLLITVSLIITMFAAYVLTGCTPAEPAVSEAVEQAEEAVTTEAATEETEAATEETEAAKDYSGTVLSLLHDKGGNPNFQPYFEAMGAKTEELFGISIEPVPYPTTDVFIATVNAALSTKDAPDMFTWWSTWRMKDLIDQGLLAPTTALWDKHKDEYSEGLRNAFTFDGEAYGYSYTQEYWPVWYNKDVFAQYNLEEPTTWAEFEAVCDTLLENGITPMAQTVQARWPTFIMFEQFVIGEDPQLYVDLCEGRVKYSDPKVKAAFEVWKDLIDRGYFTDPGIDYFVDAPSMFNTGEVGMILAGTWYYESVLVAAGVTEEQVGAFILPSQKESAGKNVVLEMSPICISANSQNLEATMVAVDYFMSAEGNEIFAKLNKAYPSNVNSNTDFLPEIKVKIADTIKNENYNILNRYWEATPTPICEEAVDKFAEFITNPDKLDQILADLDVIADKFWSENQ